MAFPEVERVVYARNPLVDVSFEVRFPKFLPIESEVPADFQKLIIGDYPQYEQRSLVQITLASGATEGSVPASETPGRRHVFMSGDTMWQVALSSDVLKVSTKSYERWEGFKDRSARALSAFLRIYQPAVFTRVGLRYQDIIRPAKLGLEGVPWNRLLQPHIAGEFVGGVLPDRDFVNRQTTTMMRLGDGELLRLRHGLLQHRETKEMGYLIDSYFYDQNQRTADLNGTLDTAERLHRNSDGLFRWCITQQLHDAMGPTPA
jgi:uncharacterized protein (TIGR04255 family)